MWWGPSWKTSWQHQELRDDRALVFADVLAAGESRHEYLARATTAGPVRDAARRPAEAMYRPELHGRSTGGHAGDRAMRRAGATAVVGLSLALAADAVLRCILRFGGDRHRAAAGAVSDGPAGARRRAIAGADRSRGPAAAGAAAGGRRAGGLGAARPRRTRWRSPPPWRARTTASSSTGASTARAVLRAAWLAVRHGRMRSGASTITMQLVRTARATPARRARASWARCWRRCAWSGRWASRRCWSSTSTASTTATAPTASRPPPSASSAGRPRR